MINKDEATAIAQAYIEKIQNPKVELVLLTESTRTKPYGWVFFFNSKKFVETKNFRDANIGPGPLLVKKEDGQIVAFGSGIRASEQLDKWAKENGWQ